MKFRKQIITLLGAVLLSSSVSTTGVASADTTDSNPVTNITNTNDPNQSTALINGLIHLKLVTSMVCVQCSMLKYSV